MSCNIEKGAGDERVRIPTSLKEKAKLLYLLLTCAALALIIYLARSGFFNELTTVAKAHSAKVYSHNHLIAEIALEAGAASSFVLPELPEFEFEINDAGAIRIKRADCPDQLCVQAGYIDHSGDTLICLPQALLLQLE